MDKDLQKDDRQPGDEDGLPGRRERAARPALRAGHPAVAVGGVEHGLNAIVFWVILNLIWLGIFGYAIYWFLGATTSVYADLGPTSTAPRRTRSTSRRRKRSSTPWPRPPRRPKGPRPTAGRRAEAPASESGDKPEDDEAASDDTGEADDRLIRPRRHPGAGSPPPAHPPRAAPAWGRSLRVGGEPTSCTALARRHAGAGPRRDSAPGASTVRLVAHPPWRPSSAHAGGVRGRAIASRKPEDPSDESPAQPASGPGPSGRCCFRPRPPAPRTRTTTPRSRSSRRASRPRTRSRSGAAPSRRSPAPRTRVASRSS